MLPIEVCERCGEPIPPGGETCPYCAGQRPFPFLHREPVLIAMMLTLAVGLWLVAHGVTQGYGHRQDVLARTWYEAGNEALGAGKYKAAIADLQTALVYSHERPDVRLRLAEALAADGRIRQAQAYLRALWEQEPGDATVNLQLARLAVRTGDVPSAQRYYQGAIYGEWTGDPDPVRKRMDTRLELVRFLLGRAEFQQAQAELIALAANEPDDPDFILRTGQMFLQAGAPARALDQFRLVLRKESRNAEAYAGAGEAAFEQGAYTDARRYLMHATSLNPSDARSASLLHTCELVLDLNPYAPRIRLDERNSRVVRDVAQTLNRLEQCAAAKNIDLSNAEGGGPVAVDYQQLDQMQARATASGLRRDPDLVDQAMDLVFRSQADATSVCGQPEGADLALLLIARANGGGQ